MKRGSLRSKIPTEIREQLAEDPWMATCLLETAGTCTGRIQWHHGFTYAGRRQNELWSLVPLCERHHKQESMWRTIIEKAMRYRIAHFKASEEFRTKYPKSTLQGHETR